MIKAGIIGFGKMGKIRAKSFEKCGGQISMVYEYNKLISTEEYNNGNFVNPNTEVYQANPKKDEK